MTSRGPNHKTHHGTGGYSFPVWIPMGVRSFLVVPADWRRLTRTRRAGPSVAA